MIINKLGINTSFKKESMGDKRDKIIDFVKHNGPSLPMQVGNAVGLNSVFSGAILSELVSSKKLKITSVKKGNSPLYYTPGDEHKLENFAACLGEKDKRTYEELKQKKVLVDNILTPLERVSLRQLKDYAVPMQTNERLCWRYYLVPEQEALALIRGISPPEVPEEAQSDQELKHKPVHSPAIDQPINIEKLGISVHQPKTMQQSGSAPQLKTIPEQDIKQILRQNTEQNPKPGQEIIPKMLHNQETELQKTEFKPVFEVQEQIEPIADTTENGLKSKKPKKTQKLPHPVQHPAMINENPARDFFAKNNLKVISTGIVSKKEMDFETRLVSELGTIHFFVKFMDKKKISEGDLSLAWTQASAKAMPLLFLGTGEMTKRAEQLIEKQLKGAIFRQI